MAKDPTTGTRSVKKQKKKPSAAQAKLRVGKVQEDGSFRVQGGGVYDPDTGKVRKKK